jgi:hypothetical protein
MKVLTPISVRNAKARQARVEIPDAGCRGLYLIIQPSGGKSWAARYRIGGVPCKLTLGSVLLGDGKGSEPETVLGGPLSLSAARKLASEALHAAQLGRHLGHAKKARKLAAAEAQADTFAAIAASYMRREGSRRGFRRP